MYSFLYVGNILYSIHTQLTKNDGAYSTITLKLILGNILHLRLELLDTQTAALYDLQGCKLSTDPILQQMCMAAVSLEQCNGRTVQMVDVKQIISVISNSMCLSYEDKVQLKNHDFETK